MKYILTLLCSFMVACSTAGPVHPDSTRAGNFRVEELDANRKTVRIYRTKQFTHTYFPRSISFVTNDGKPVRLVENFEVFREE